MIAERYHGSTSRAIAASLFRPVSWLVRRLALLFGPRKAHPEVERLLAEGSDLCARQEWERGFACVRAAADIEESNPGTSARLAGAALIGIGDCRRGLGLMSRPVQLAGVAEWNGEDVSAATLVVAQRTKSDMGAPIRLARFVTQAEQMAERCIVIVESRLVPIFRRTFARSTVVSMGDALPAVSGPIFATSMEGLAAHCVTDWKSIANTFVPLQAKPELTDEFRRKYRQGTRGAVVGITWGSQNANKDTPRLASWGRFVQSFPATFVSLQYGAVDAALKKLRGDQPDRLIEDATVDQLHDMDRFAAQVASLDAIIATSNTATHLAGALGMPLVLLKVNRLGVFPVSGTSTQWYPRGMMVHKRTRSWDTVLDEAAVMLTGLLSLESRAEDRS